MTIQEISALAGVVFLLFLILTPAALAALEFAILILILAAKIPRIGHSIGVIIFPAFIVLLFFLCLEVPYIIVLIFPEWELLSFFRIEMGIISVGIVFPVMILRFLNGKIKILHFHGYREWK